MLKSWVRAWNFTHVGRADEQDGDARPLGLDVPNVLAHLLRVAPGAIRVGDGRHGIASELQDDQGWVGVLLQGLPVGIGHVVKQRARTSPHGQVVHVDTRA